MQTLSDYLKEVDCGPVHSVAELLEDDGVIEETTFLAWQNCTQFWTPILGKLLDRDTCWFDIVLPDPVTSRFVYTAVFRGEKQSYSNFELVQQAADSDFYRQKVASLSRIYVDGWADPRRRLPIRLHRRSGDLRIRYEQTKDCFSILLQQPEPWVRLFERSAWEESARSLQTCDAFATVAEQLRRAIGVESSLDPLRLAYYIAWLTFLPDWRTYIYLPLTSYSRKSGAVVLAFTKDIDHLRMQQIRDDSEYGLHALAMKVSQIAENAVPGFARRAASAAVISRNMSHNLGSHVIAGLTWAEMKRYAGEPDVIEPNGSTMGRAVESFVGYLQQRMDFVARVATEWPRWQEPVLFVRELIRPFTQQTVLLERIASDVGVTNVRFMVSTPSMRGQYSVLTDETLRNIPDVTLSIRGGVAGRQAFYGFLENAIRNAARHGNRRDELNVYLGLADAPHRIGHVTCLYGDDFSDREIADASGQLVAPWIAMDNKIAKPLIDIKTADLTRSDWGIQEMKIYASILSGDAADVDRDRDILKARECELPEGRKVLGYEFALPRANLLAVAGEQDEGADDWRFVDHGICRLTARLDTEAGRQAFLGECQTASPALLYVRMPDDETDFNAVVSWLIENEALLPSRLLLGTSRQSTGRPFHRALIGRCFAVAPEVGPDDRFPWPCHDDQQATQQLIVRLRKKWLRAFDAEQRCREIVCGTADSEAFQIILFVDRDVSQKLESWARLGETVRQFGLDDVVEAYLFYDGESEADIIAPWTPTATSMIPAEFRSQISPRRLLCFDNHSKLSHRGITSDATLFHHTIGHRYGHDDVSSRDGLTSRYSNNASIFSRLTNVADDFCGLLALLDLIEACLLRLLIIDERFVDMAYAGGRDREPDLVAISDLSKARITVLSRVQCDGVLIPLHPRVTNPDWLPLLRIRTDTPEVFVRELDARFYPTEPSCDEPIYDVAIIHWRQVDLVAQQCGLSVEKVLERLRRVATRVVVTSGRGAPREGILTRAPFLEYSLLEACAIKELDKVQLGSLMMALH